MFLKRERARAKRAPSNCSAGGLRRLRRPRHGPTRRPLRWSPAGRCRSSPRRAAGPRRRSGCQAAAARPAASENVAFGSRTTRIRWTFACLRSGNASRASASARSASSSLLVPQDLVCVAGDQREMRGRLPERPPLVEHPLERALRQADERRWHRPALQPQVHRDDRRRRAGGLAGHEARQARPARCPAALRPTRTTAPPR